MLRELLDKYHRASDSVKAQIHHRIGHYTHQVSDAYDDLARRVAALPGIHHGACVRSAFAASTPRAADMIREALPAFDASTLAQAALRSMQAIAEEVA
ncbi:hypothetical protein ACFQUU_18610, partial [Herbaspirillum sp. GCM10030257]|uniref:hypothetical protein n=1 Tax=Herbaspirillum sp. GCM10030257 TaxID=3273393 RepID=UPI0036089A1A